MVMVPSPVFVTGAPGGTVPGGVLNVGNNSGVPATISSVTIAFDNADLFTTTKLTATAAGVTETSQFNPTFSTTSIDYTFSPPLVVPKGESASFSLSLTITTTPQITMRQPRAIYAGTFGTGAGGNYHSLTPLCGLLMGLSLAMAGMGSSRRRLMIALVILVLAAASQVGCDSGSIPSSSGAYESTQTAMSVAAAKQTGGPITVGGCRPL
jgi:hypothetical protein